MESPLTARVPQPPLPPPSAPPTPTRTPGTGCCWGNVGSRLSDVDYAGLDLLLETLVLVRLHVVGGLGAGAGFTLSFLFRDVEEVFTI